MGAIGIEHGTDGAIACNIQVDGVVAHQGYIHTISDRQGFKRVFGHFVLDSIGLRICPGKGLQYPISTGSITC